MGALLDRVRKTLIQLNRDQAPDPSESLEGHHLAVAVAARHQCTIWFAVGGRQDQPSSARLRHVSAYSTSRRVDGSNDRDRLSSQPHNNAGLVAGEN